METRWVPFVPYVPPGLFHSQSFAYRLRFGHLPTIPRLLRGWEAGGDYGWLRQALISQADSVDLGSHWRVGGLVDGPDKRCALCWQGLATYDHAISDCPATRATAFEGLQRVWRRLRSMGRPGILQHQRDPSHLVVSDVNFCSHLEQNPMIRMVEEDEKKLAPLCIAWGSVKSPKQVCVAAYWKLWQLTHLDDLDIYDRVEKVLQGCGEVRVPQVVNENGAEGARSFEVRGDRGPPLLPNAFEAWLMTHFRMAICLCPGGTLGATLGSFPDYHIPGGETQWRHVRTGPLTVRRLQSVPYFVNAWGIQQPQWEKMVAMIGRALRTAGTEPFRLLALLPDNVDMLKLAKKEGGRIILRIPRARMPWVAPHRWARGESFVSRDSNWYPQVGVRLVQWENKVASCAWPVLESVASDLRELCDRELRGGSQGLTLRLRGKANPLEIAPAIETRYMMLGVL